MFYLVLVNEKHMLLVLGKDVYLLKLGGGGGWRLSMHIQILRIIQTQPSKIAHFAALSCTEQQRLPLLWQVCQNRIHVL